MTPYSKVFRTKKAVKFVRSLAMTCLIILLPALTPVVAQINEHEIQAALIAKISSFVVWPEKHRPHPEQKPNLCFMEDPDQAAISPLFIKNGILNEHFNIYTRAGSQFCHITYIAETSEQRLASLLEEIPENTPTLTFSASHQFAQLGVMVNFYVENEKMRFEINRTALQKAGLSISSRVLKLARIVDE